MAIDARMCDAMKDGLGQGSEARSLVGIGQVSGVEMKWRRCEETDDETENGNGETEGTTRQRNVGLERILGCGKGVESMGGGAETKEIQITVTA